MTTPSQPSPAFRQARGAEPTAAMPAVGGKSQQPTSTLAPGATPHGVPTGTGWAESPRRGDGGRPDAPAASAGSAPAPASAPRTRRARLVLSRIDPWSAMKLSFMLSIAMAIVLVVAVYLIWSMLDQMGAFEAVNRSVVRITQADDGSAFDVMNYIALQRVIGVTTIIACFNIVIVTALSTLAAFLYNITTSLVGGLHVTLTEDR